MPGRRSTAFGLITGQVGYAWNNVLFYVKGGGAVVGDKYDFALRPVFVGAGTVRSGQRNALGRHRGRRPRVRLRTELVGWRRVQPHLPRQPHRHFTLHTVGTVLSRTDRISQDVDMGLVRVNYRWGGPLIAKY